MAKNGGPHQQVHEKSEDAQKCPETSSARDDLQGEATGHNTVNSTFRSYQKAFIVTMAIFAAMMSQLSSQMYFPAIPLLAQHYQVTTGRINLSITTYMIVQGLAPSVIGSFSDTGGRRPAYIASFLIFLAANIGLALQNSYVALLALRCIQSAGSSAATSLGYAVAADIASSNQRGRYMGLINGGYMVSLSLGPTLGGILVNWLQWRSIFWFLVIFSGSCLAIYVIAMPETSKELVGHGNLIPNAAWRRSIIQCVSLRCHKRSTLNIPMHQKQEHQVSKPPRFNPFSTLAVFRNKAAFITICYIGLIFSVSIAVMTTTANLFGVLYGLNSFKIGLCFIPFGVTGCVGSILTGTIIDLNYRRIARQCGYPLTNETHHSHGEFPFERARLQVAFPLIILAIATIVPYGWVLEQHVPLFAPLILQGVLGFCCTGSMNVLSSLLIDLSPNRPATAAAALNLVRCWLGAVLAAVLQYLLSGMGWGWCFCFFGLVLVAASPLLLVEYWYGMKWRSARRDGIRDTSTPVEGDKCPVES